MSASLTLCPFVSSKVSPSITLEDVEYALIHTDCVVGVDVEVIILYSWSICVSSFSVPLSCSSVLISDSKMLIWSLRLII